MLLCGRAAGDWRVRRREVWAGGAGGAAGQGKGRGAGGDGGCLYHTLATLLRPAVLFSIGLQCTAVHCGVKYYNKCGVKYCTGKFYVKFNLQ